MEVVVATAQGVNCQEQEVPRVILGQNCIWLLDAALYDLFFQKFVLSKSVKYAMNIGVTQRWPFTVFDREKVSFYYLCRMQPLVSKITPECTTKLKELRPYQKSGNRLHFLGDKEVYYLQASWRFYKQQKENFYSSSLLWHSSSHNILKLKTPKGDFANMLENKMWAQCLI